MAIWPVRVFIYIWLFMISAVLLGLTAYRVHYTKRRREGDIPSDRTHYYDPIIIELIVASCLGILLSLYLIASLFGRFARGGLARYSGEHMLLFITWVFFLIGAAITTSKWSNLRGCRHDYKVCRVLETIKAFAWMAFGFTTLAFIMSLIDMIYTKSRFSDDYYGRSVNTAGATRLSGGSTYPDTRETTTTTTIHTRAAPTTATTTTPVPATTTTGATVV